MLDWNHSGEERSIIGHNPKTARPRRLQCLQWKRACRLWGATSLYLRIGGVACLVVSTSLPAQAGLMKNGLEIGDRSRIHVTSAPGPEERRFAVQAVAESTSEGSLVPPKRIRAPGAEKQIEAQAAPAAGTELLHRIARRFGPEIAAAANKHKISEALILAVIAVESAGRSDARSHAGAEGLMQLIPATAERFGVTDSFDPLQNLDGGAAYLSWLLKIFRNDLGLALAGYNAGEGAVKKHGGVPPYPETRDYIAKVVATLARADEICARAPAHPHRSCA